MRVWIDGSVADPAIRIFGLGLLERHLLALRRLAKEQKLAFQVTIDLGSTGMPEPAFDEKLRKRLAIRIARGEGNLCERVGRALDEAGGEAVMLLSGEVLCDGRLYLELARRQGGVVVAEGEGAERAAMLLLGPAERALLPAQATSFADLADRLVGAGLPRLRQEDFNGFIRNLRRTLPFYLHVVRKRSKARELQRFLFWSNYKGSTDFFTAYVYPPLVWLLVRPLAALRVHPNVVTIVSIVMTFAAIPFFARGDFAIGLLLAYGMSVLDSVDGKLARLTFTDSKLGNVLDHGLDLIHPPMWYVAWAWGLAGGDMKHPLMLLAWISTAVYVFDRLVLKVYPTLFNRGLHTHSRLDTMARTFISRRNINLPIFTIGVFADWLLGGHAVAGACFRFIVFWQVVTLAFHAWRTAWIVLVEKAHRDPSRVSAT
ncbi:MAG: CDP-alcohol phosphatidyltransferase family protein [Alphaproteobacteria bacterium]|nr:CDP-alcohol phosphatidyltransferase family protein [Alphaproteobacteria bacterium]